jgi:radical SAM protein with 4Fe4S-binding SPASM domain
MVCGMFPFNDPVDVYQRSPVFRHLRDADQLGGKCGVCEFRHVCGGSRARAMAVSGDPYAAEPDCAYRPKGWG